MDQEEKQGGSTCGRKKKKKLRGKRNLGEKIRGDKSKTAVVCLRRNTGIGQLAAMEKQVICGPI